MDSKEWDKLAKNYFEEILSPFAKNVENPIFSTINLLKNKNSVIDLGCGLGILENYLAKDFKRVTAVDFSEKMIESAVKNNKNKNVKFLVLDLNQLRHLLTYPAL